MLKLYIYLHACVLLNAGVFNVSNKIFVTLDILFNMRCHIRKGEPPGKCAQAVLESACFCMHSSLLTNEEKAYLEQKLYDGYFSFEASTYRNWDNAICGICGVAPVFESGDGNCKNCTPIKRGQVCVYSCIVHLSIYIILWKVSVIIPNLAYNIAGESLY